MNTIRRVWSLITAMIFCFNVLVPNGLTVKAAQQTSGNSKNYLIVTKDKETVKQLERTYDKTDEIGENAQGNLVKNHMTSVALTQNEVKKLEKDADICYQQIPRMSVLYMSQLMNKYFPPILIQVFL